MTPLPLLLVAILLHCLQAPHPAASTGPPPTPTPWPQRFHAELLMDYRGNLSLADLWYDWPRGRNLHVIRYQLAADAPYYDAEWNNGTSFFYTPARRSCRSVKVGVGILRPDWLTPGAAYLGRATAGGFDCHVWTKADFITYYEDVATGRPVKWVFYTGRTAHVMSFEPGAVLEDAQWQVPAYCFAKGAAENTLVYEPADWVGSDGSKIKGRRETSIAISPLFAWSSGTEEEDFSLRRFLRARDHNIGKASAMLLQYLSWKRATKPHGTITDDEMRDEIAKERVHLQGFDRLGRPMVYLYGARHFPAGRDLDEFKRYVAYVLDKICTRLPAGQEKFAVVIDMKGWGYSNCDIRGYVAGLDIMQSYYPERLGRVFLIHVPYMFMAAWKVVYPFIDERTRKKFMFVADKNLDATLRYAIDESQLLEDYGGKLKLQA